VSTARLVIAAPASGSGKTTVATGLMAALRAAGLTVSGHKVGPDYIDPGYHALATGRPGRNLDPFLCGEALIGPLFAHGAAGADIAVIEGVMGLFDGCDPVVSATVTAGRSEPGFASTAHVARLLRAPVVLVVDAAAVGRSVAALLAGFTGFDPRVNVAGVIFNRVGSDRHERLLRDAVEPFGTRVFGVIKRTDAAATPARHLGLVPAAERGAAARRTVGRLAGLIAASCDLAGLRALAATAPPLACQPWRPGPATPADSPPADRPSADWAPADWAPPDCAPPDRAGPTGAAARAAPAPPPGWAAAARPPHRRGREPVASAGRPGGRSQAPVIAVAQGPAFTFSYAEHGELLAAAGARLAPFDPLTDAALPDGTAGLVIGGGFPQVYAPELAANEPLRRQVAALAAAGAPIVAECAGLLYLARTLDGLPMCAVIGVDARMTERLTLGYRSAVAACDSVLARAGEAVRGHEFHRTAATPRSGRRAAWRLAGHDGSGRTEGHVLGNVVASYLHTHWALTPAFASRLCAACVVAGVGSSAPPVASSTVASSTVPSSTVASSTVASSTVPSSTVASSTVASSTVPSSTVPSSTVPSSTVPSSGVGSSAAGNSAAGNNAAGDTSVGKGAAGKGAAGRSAAGRSTADKRTGGRTADSAAGRTATGAAPGEAS
jgi:cobyrinic acid a,c-diamide synthase